MDHLPIHRPKEQCQESVTQVVENDKMKQQKTSVMVPYVKVGKSPKGEKVQQ